jgi:hypothetical protein
MYETLMYLVSIHAQVSRAAEPLLDRTLSALVNELADESLRCFRQVKRFGMGGMLRVRVSHPYRKGTVSLIFLGNARNRIYAPNPRPLCHTVSCQDVIRLV